MAIKESVEAERQEMKLKKQDQLAIAAEFDAREQKAIQKV